nr:MAG TPA: hypothetical protein [Caudoviricetes sp.]
MKLMLKISLESLNLLEKHISETERLERTNAIKLKFLFVN